MNIGNRPPLGLKAPKLGKDPARLAAVRQLPCVVCHEYGMAQNSPTEAHHCKSGRYSTHKAPDCMTIPLCHSHHNKLRPYPGDEDKIGFHNGQATWEAEYGPDVDWIGWTDERLKAQ